MRACSPADAGVSQQTNALAHAGAGQCGANGFYQLPDAKHYLYVDILWLWAWLLQQVACSSGLLCCICHLNSSTPLLIYLVAAFPLHAF